MFLGSVDNLDVFKSGTSEKVNSKGPFIKPRLLKPLEAKRNMRFSSSMTRRPPLNEIKKYEF